MQDLIEDDDISMWRLLAIALHAVTMLVLVAFTPRALAQDDISAAHW